MRMRKSRIQVLYHRTHEVKKDREGSSYDSYGAAVEFQGEVWPASGKVQAEIYGEKLTYIRNLRVDGSYVITTDKRGIIHYVYPSGLDIVESDGICIYTDSQSDPDYKIVSVKPYRQLQMECMKL